MEHRAEENLRAAELLVDDMDCLAPAVSRAYYAAYLATWAEMTHRGTAVPQHENGRYFRHRRLPADAAADGVLDDELEDALEFLESSRVAADYRADEVLRPTAQRAIAHARRILTHVLDGGE